MANKEYITSQLDDIIKALINIKNSVAESEERGTEKESVNGDVPVGNTFEFEGKEYIVKESGRTEYDNIANHVIESICDLCAFDKSGSSLCDQLCCAWFERRDETDVYYVKKK